jgi:hypothetical protein
MMSSQFHTLCNQTAGSDWLFAFRGHFVEQFTASLVDIGEGASAIPEGAFKRKMSFMLVESFQNILKHAESRHTIQQPIDDEGMFSFRHKANCTLIHSINVIRNESLALFKEAIERVNSLDAKELKELHLQSLQDNQLSERGGAGLGMIEMARKSGNKIHYRVDQIDGEFSFLHQMIVLGSEVNEESLAGALEENAKFYGLMHQHRLMVFYKGDFTRKTILPIIEMTELGATQSEADARLSVKAIHVVVEMLQNVSRHTGDQSNQSFFAMGKNHVGLQVFTSNMIDPSHAEILRDKLRFLGEQNREDLKTLHREALRASLHFENKKSSGLGLIEIAQACALPMEGSFFNMDSGTPHFVLKCVV